MIFTSKQFDFTNKGGMSDAQWDAHKKLYDGYVVNTQKTADAVKNHEPNTPEYNELKRRLGWEYNGVVLHELFFENISNEKQEIPDGPLKEKISVQWGSEDACINEIIATGMMRGIGWTALIHDPERNHLFIQWIGEHNENHIPNTKILLIIDVWEHAYMSDYSATERKAYLKQITQYIDWSTVRGRM